eukprot:5907726-Ditylum_brightwellii.AAC.1
MPAVIFRGVDATLFARLNVGFEREGGWEGETQISSPRISPTTTSASWGAPMCAGGVITWCWRYVFRGVVRQVCAEHCWQGDHR